MEESQRQRVLKWARTVEPDLYDKLFASVAATRSLGRLRFWQEKLLERIVDETGVAISSADAFVACFAALTPREPAPATVDHDLAAWYTEVTKALKAKLPLSDGIQALLAYCNKQQSWHGWDRIGE